MIHLISSLSYSQKKDFLILSLLAVLISAAFALSSLAIEVLENYDNVYVPTKIDYLRVFLLSSIASLIVNSLYRFVSKYALLLKVWLSFLCLLLLAYPQKTEHHRSRSRWNLVKREAYLYGVFYEIVSLGFYLVDQLSIASGDYELLRESLDSELESNSISQAVRQKSTLENCLQIGRNSNNLRKILYPESYNQALVSSHMDSIEEAPLTVSKSDHLQIPNYSAIENDSLRSNSSSSFKNLHQVASSGSMITGMLSVSKKSHHFLPSKMQWHLDHLYWIFSQFLCEIGIALVLSISFVYDPNLDDSKFSGLQKYFYNKSGEFVLEVVLPLFLGLSALHMSAVHVTLRQLSSRGSTTGIVATYWAHVAVSVFLFILGMLTG
jgi:hypothetical protein